MGSTANGGEGTATGAAYAALHVASALVQRDRTGEGCFIDAAGADGVAANSWVALTYALNDHRITDRSTMPARAEGENVGAKYQFYETRDGKVILFCCIEPKFWRSFLRGDRTSGSRRRRQARTRRSNGRTTSSCAASCRASSTAAT